LKGKNMANVAVFLDRDDTIIEDPGYINDPAQVKLLRGVAESLRRLQKMGYKLVVVTNQSAVARGIISEEVLEEIHERLQNLLIRRRVHLDAIYYCPYHPEGVIAKYRRESDLRKPGSGMLLQAAEDLDIDLEQSWMIGNSYSDITAGANAGCKTILISSSAKLPERKRGDACQTRQDRRKPDRSGQYHQNVPAGEHGGGTQNRDNRIRRRGRSRRSRSHRNRRDIRRAPKRPQKMQRKRRRPKPSNRRHRLRSRMSKSHNPNHQKRNRMRRLHGQSSSQPVPAAGP